MCVNCHGTPLQLLNLDLQSPQSYGNLVNAASLQVTFPLVTPFRTDLSYFLQKLDGRDGITLGRMPLPGPIEGQTGGPFLTDAQVELVRSWIAAGALNN